MDSYRFGAGRYIQGENALDYCGEEIKRYGCKAYVIGGNMAINVTEKRMCESFAKSELEYCIEKFSGYPSIQKIEELKNSVKETSCDVIVGVGGGRIMDLVKATAFELGVPIVAIPTQAATCAAYSPLSVLYTPEGHSDKYIHFEYEVNAIIVDDKVMLTQTPRLLAAGILDGMAKYIEIATLHPQVLDENTPIGQNSALYMAKYTYDVLKQKGEKAVADLKAGIWTKDLHDIIYVNIALTGIVSALMQGKGQTALGHAFNNALHRDFLEYIKKWLHGEGVALGLLAQLVYNEKEDLVEELQQLMMKFHMPCSLADIGLSINDENFDKLYQRLCTFPFMTHDRKHEELLKEAINSLGEWKNDIKGNE